MVKNELQDTYLLLVELFCYAIKKKKIQCLEESVQCAVYVMGKAHKDALYPLSQTLTPKCR